MVWFEAIAFCLFRIIGISQVISSIDSVQWQENRHFNHLTRWQLKWYIFFFIFLKSRAISDNQQPDRTLAYRKNDQAQNVSNRFQLSHISLVSVTINTQLPNNCYYFCSIVRDFCCFQFILQSLAKIPFHLNWIHIFN